jgi:hypothetical protein
LGDAATSHPRQPYRLLTPAGSSRLGSSDHAGRERDASAKPQATIPLKSLSSVRKWPDRNHIILRPGTAHVKEVLERRLLNRFGAAIIADTEVVPYAAPTQIARIRPKERGRVSFCEFFLCAYDKLGSVKAAPWPGRSTRALRIVCSPGESSSNGHLSAACSRAAFKRPAKSMISQKGHLFSPSV